MLISIIIPTLNEEENIEKLIAYLRRDPSYPLITEIIVVDGNSEDRTSEMATKTGVTVLGSKHRSRAVQMNLGAERASGQVLYFLHADTFPPTGYAQKIWQATRDHYISGCFRLRFDWSHWFLSTNCWFTRFNTSIFRFGDQSLFVNKEVFMEVNGFNENLRMFEDQDIVKRLSHHGQFVVLPHYVVTSARKYRKNGPFRLQLVYFLIYLLYAFGFSQSTLMRTYQSLVPFPMV